MEKENGEIAVQENDKIIEKENDQLVKKENKKKAKNEINVAENQNYIAELSPDGDLEFIGEDVNHSSHALIRIKNVSGKNILYKIMLQQVELFKVSPQSAALLKKDQSTYVTVTLKHGARRSEYALGSHLLVMLWVLNEEQEHTLQLTKGLMKSEVKKIWRKVDQSEPNYGQHLYDCTFQYKRMPGEMQPKTVVNDLSVDFTLKRYDFVNGLDTFTNEPGRFIREMDYFMLKRYWRMRSRKGFFGILLISLSFLLFACLALCMFYHKMPRVDKNPKTEDK